MWRSHIQIQSYLFASSLSEPLCWLWFDLVWFSLVLSLKERPLSPCRFILFNFFFFFFFHSDKTKQHLRIIQLLVDKEIVSG